MNILMLTNTFSPYVGGVARSVQGFTDEFRSQGHRVMVAAPRYKTLPEGETDVIRFPAIKHVNGTEFSLPMPTPGRLNAVLRHFKPDVVHTHHPFALGGTALRVSAARQIPLVFTHHTMYEKYTHYAPWDTLRLKRYVVSLVTGYCNYCDAVIAPSETVAALLQERGVKTPTTVIPTGVKTEKFISADGASFRQQIGIPPDAFVVGHVGRLASEKNLEFLARSVIRFLHQHQQAFFLLAGEGPMLQVIEALFDAAGLTHRLRSAGLLHNAELAAAYKSMDLFAFSSHTETQGMVLAEAMAAGTPVVAVDAAGVREVVEDGRNGRLLPRADEEQFASALSWMAQRSRDEQHEMAQQAHQTGEIFDIRHTAAKAVELYQTTIERTRYRRCRSEKQWLHAHRAHRKLRSEWRIVSNVAKAAGTLCLPMREPYDFTVLTSCCDE